MPAPRRLAAPEPVVIIEEAPEGGGEIEWRFILRHLSSGDYRRTVAPGVDMIEAIHIGYQGVVAKAFRDGKPQSAAKVALEMMIAVCEASGYFSFTPAEEDAEAEEEEDGD